MRKCPTIVGLLGLLCTLPAQVPVEQLDRLIDPAQRTRATIELRRQGPAAATALLDALERPDARSPELLAETLAGLGSATAAELARLVRLLPQQPEPQRTWLLRAIANAMLGATDPAAIEAVRENLHPWAQAGFFYSPAPDAPTFAWQEYVRLKRRLQLRDGGTQADDLDRALDRIRVGRASLNALGVLGGQRADIHDLTAFGQHATREELEAIAELALLQGALACAAVDELARYLAHEAPRPAQLLTESCAGIGENAPAPADAAQWPTLWRRDDWRFAVARAVFALSTAAPSRVLALRHLLQAPLAAERLEAIAAVRAWPQPWHAFAPELGDCLDSSDRLVVRDALVTFGLTHEIALPLEALRRLAGGEDRELAMLAKRLLR